MGSRLQDVEGDFIIISRTESSDITAKLENVTVEEFLQVYWVFIVSEGGELKLSLMHSILSAKKMENRSASDAPFISEGRTLDALACSTFPLSEKVV